MLHVLFLIQIVDVLGRRRSAVVVGGSVVVVVVIVAAAVRRHTARRLGALFILVRATFATPFNCNETSLGTAVVQT